MPELFLSRGTHIQRQPSGLCSLNFLAQMGLVLLMEFTAETIEKMG